MQRLVFAVFGLIGLALLLWGGWRRPASGEGVRREMSPGRTVNLALLSVRGGLGLLFLASAAAKAADAGRFAKTVFASNLLSPPWMELYAVASPAWDAVIGLACLLGWATRPTAGAVLLSLAGYAAYIWAVAGALTGAPGRPPWATPAGPFSTYAALFACALALAPCALALALAGGGAYAVDALRARRAAAPGARRRRLSRLALGLIVLNVVAIGILANRVRERSVEEARTAECLDALGRHREAYAERASLDAPGPRELADARVRTEVDGVRARCG